MSPSPLSKFSKLSISPTMEQTSRGTHASSIDKGKGKAPLQDESSNDSDEDPEDPEDPEGEETTDSSNDGHLMALDHCRPIYDSDKLPVYAFQIAYAKVEPYSLRIRDRGGRVACSCGEEDCRHREWLLRQLSMIPSPQAARAGPGPVSVDYYDRIRRAGSHGLEDVCRLLSWEFRAREGETDPGTEWELRKLPPPPESVEYPESEYHRSLIRHSLAEIPDSGHVRQTRRTTAQRVNTVRDIMDTFYGTLRSADYRQDIFKDPTNIDVDNFFVENDLEATFCRLLMFDKRLFHFFELRVSNDARAVNFFQNMRLEAVEALSFLDNYVDNGPGEDGRQYDVPWCAQRLVDIVTDIGTNYNERGGGGLSPSSQRIAAGALVSILEMVVDRNRDVYAVENWHRQRRHGEGRVHRNLYERLIGNSSPENPSGGGFVLNALLDMAPGAVVHVERLETVLFNIGPRGSRAPQAYQDRLRGLIQALRKMPRPDPSGPGSSSGKRSGGSPSTDRSIKRMK